MQEYDPCVHLSGSTIHLVGGIITYPDLHEARFTKTEYKLFLNFLEKALVSRNGYLQMWYLLEVVYGRREEPANASHALEQHIHNIRRKLKNTSYLKTFSGMGYQLTIPSGCCTASVQEVRKLISEM